MAKLGYKEGADVSYVVQDSKGDVNLFDSLATKMVDTKPDVIFTVTTMPTLSAKKATQTIPIVFTVVGDPVQIGAVASFASSQNNLTGVASINSALTAKRLEVLKELAPGTKRILAIVATKEASAEVSFNYLRETAKKLGLQIVRREVTGKKDTDALFLERWSALADSVISIPSVFAVSHIMALIAKTKSEKLPLMVSESSHAENGALASYAGDFRSFGVQAASLVVKALKKAKPADIPVPSPERLFLTLNTSTAKAIGLKLPRTVLDRADRLVE